MLTPPHSFLISQTQSQNISLADQKNIKSAKLAHTLLVKNLRAVMKTFGWLIPVLFGLNLVFAGCDERDRQSNTRTSATPSASKINDDDLEKAVRAKIEEDRQ